MSNLLHLAFSMVVTTALAYGTILPLCGLIFGCGCTLSSGITHCNIFVAARPDCPWCSQSALAFWTLFAAIMAACAVTIGVALRWVKPVLGVGLASGVLGYFLWRSLAGLGHALWHDYPMFCGVTLP